MGNTTLLYFNVKNNKLACVMTGLPLKVIMDKRDRLSVTNRFGKEGFWYSEDCLNLDVPNGGSIGQWFLELMRDPEKEFADLYYEYEGKRKAVEQEMETNGGSFYDEKTLGAEIEIANIHILDNGEDNSNYAYEKRTETETTIIHLSAKQWAQNSAHESLAEALTGNQSKIRTYARKKGDVKVISCALEQEEPVAAPPVMDECDPYIAALAKPEDWKYQVIKRGKLQLTEYIGNDDVVYIPEMIDGQTVIELGSRLFYEKAFIKKVYMPDTVKALKTEAFVMGSHSKLEAIRFSQKLKEIGMKAFSWMPVSTLDIPASVLQVKGGAFSSELKTVVFRGNPKISTHMHIFDWDDAPTVYAPAGGTVETYCKKLGIRFRAIEV